MTSRAAAALAAGVLLTLGAAQAARAADLGGTCCADLEERIAELESTTARKGNRKVSLTVSGWVNEAVFFWDDGTEQNTYVGTNSVEQSRVRFSGEAKIDKDWSAGYILEVGLQGALSGAWSQDAPAPVTLNPNSANNGLIVRKSNWFVKSKTLGQVAVGLNGGATYHLLDDADFTATRNVADAESPSIFLSAFGIRENGNFIGNGGNAALNRTKWSDILRGFNNSTPGDNGRRNVVRYDSPAFEGFTIAAAWGEDDLWDAALIYKNDIGDFTIAARAGYGESTDFGSQVGPSAPAGNNAPTSYVIGGTTCVSGTTVSASAAPADFHCSWGGAAATIQHKPTGIFLYGGWGTQRVTNLGASVANTIVNPDSYTWFIQPGVDLKLTKLGKTTVFGTYRHDDAGSNPGRSLASSVDFWQGGVIQTLESADALLYMVYEHVDGTVDGQGANLPGSTTGNGLSAGTHNLDAFQTVVVGTKINF